MKKQHKVGDYITFRTQYPGNEQEFHGNGHIEKILEKDGRTQYLVAEGNGGANLTYVDPARVLSLLTE